MKIKLAMFDLDGTLFDTARANYLSYQKACEDYVDIDEVFFVSECMSRNYKDFLPLLGIADEEIMEQVHSKKKEIYTNYMDEIRVNDSLFAIAQALRVAGAYLVIVTTASRKNTQELLKKFGYETFFDLLVTQEDVEKQKPAPDGYIYAMDYFGVSSENAVVFEDSSPGIEAARLSGASVYKIEGFYGESNEKK